MNLPDKNQTSEENPRENRKNQEQNNTVRKITVDVRRKLVHSLDLQGLSNLEISEQRE
jgi:hypothetical protein